MACFFLVTCFLTVHYCYSSLSDISLFLPILQAIFLFPALDISLLLHPFNPSLFPSTCPSFHISFDNSPFRSFKFPFLLYQFRHFAPPFYIFKYLFFVLTSHLAVPVLFVCLEELKDKGCSASLFHNKHQTASCCHWMKCIKQFSVSKD